MLDLAVFPPGGAAAPCEDANVPLLTLESEMGPEHGVGHVINRYENNYAWDFFKLLLVPSPRRLFVARVGKRTVPGRDRLNTLCQSLDDIAGRNRSLLRKDTIIAYVLAQDADDYQHSQVGVWNGDRFGWEAIQFKPSGS